MPAPIDKIDKIQMVDLLEGHLDKVPQSHL